MNIETPGDFWSRRKAKVAAEAAVEVDVVATSEPERTDEEILTDLGLPDPNTIALGDDVKGFMVKAVPEHLRRIALRQLWRSNPTLACLDGLVDYADDYTDSATVVEGMKTAYQVGKGMTAHVEEMARKAAALLEDDEAVEAAPACQEEPAAVVPPQQVAEVEPDEVPAPRRRMKFEYADPAQSLEAS